MSEMKDPKNKDKTASSIKRLLLLKNLAKNPTYYTEKGQFGDLDLGYNSRCSWIRRNQKNQKDHINQVEEVAIKQKNNVSTNYYKKVVEPTDEELKKHSAYLKNNLKKNFF